MDASVRTIWCGYLGAALALLSAAVEASFPLDDAWLALAVSSAGAPTTTGEFVAGGRPVHPKISAFVRLTCWAMCDLHSPGAKLLL